MTNETSKTRHPITAFHGGHGREGFVVLEATFCALLADVFVFYLKAHSFHRHVLAPASHKCRLLLDEQVDQIPDLRRAPYPTPR
jgi:hypothetical protein